MNTMDYIQTGLLVFVIPALIVFLIYYRNNEIKKTDTQIEDYLKCTASEPLQEYEKVYVKKGYAISFACGFFSIRILDAILTECIYRFFTPEKIGSSEEALIYSTIKLVIGASMLILSIVGPLLWIAWDKKRLQTKATLIKQPAYVHSTSNLSSSYYRNRSAYLLYWDSKKGKLRAKTVMLKQFEAKHGELCTGEFVYIAAEERKSKIRFVCALQKIQGNNI